MGSEAWGMHPALPWAALQGAQDVTPNLSGTEPYESCPREHCGDDNRPRENPAARTVSVHPDGLGEKEGGTEASVL